MKIPRDVSGTHLANVLCRRWQYAKVHQAGSHIILEFHERTRTSWPHVELLFLWGSCLYFYHPTTPAFKILEES